MPYVQFCINLFSWNLIIPVNKILKIYISWSSDYGTVSRLFDTQAREPNFEFPASVGKAVHDSLYLQS